MTSPAPVSTPVPGPGNGAPSGPAGVPPGSLPAPAALAALNGTAHSTPARSGTPLSFRHPSLLLLTFQRKPHAFASFASFPSVAVDPVTLVINECMAISSAMRKLSRWSNSGVAAILGTADFMDESIDDFSLHILSNGGGSGAAGHASSAAHNIAGKAASKSDNPLLLSFFQLRSILTDAHAHASDPHLTLAHIDTLTLLQPFLLVIKSSSTSGHITMLALQAISKFLDYQIISNASLNIQAAVIQIVSSLTHCRFEAADQNLDDAVLLKVLRLLEQILDGNLSHLLPNDVVSEVVQTCLPLACNKKRSEVLRRAAEMSMVQITIRIFNQLKEIHEVSNLEFQGNFSLTQLPEDVIGGTTDTFVNVDDADAEKDAKPSDKTTDASSERRISTESAVSVSNDPDSSETFGIVCINEFLRILISMISPSNQFQYMESTRVFALVLINTAIEVAGRELATHPSLLTLVSDSICKHILQIMTTSESPALLLSSLQLFNTITIVLGKHLKAQVELTLTLLFKSILPDQSQNKKKEAGAAIKTNDPNTTRLSASKEMLIESISILWTRSPTFFTELFIKYDCDFDNSDLSSKLIENLCQLSLPESASITTDNVPPICLESLLSFINSVNERTKKFVALKATTPATHTKKDISRLLNDKDHKVAFVKCTELLNDNPKQGLKLLKEKGFIKDLSNEKEIAEFFFSKSGRLNKKILGEYLAKPSNIEILKHFINLFQFGGLRVDEALRILLKGFRLPGESQQIERIVETFADRYVQCQEEEDKKVETKKDDEKKEDEEAVRPDRDAVFILSYSIILLNTDLHNPQVKKQMELDAYKRNLRGTYGGKDFPAWYLGKIYQAISDREIIMPEEHHGTDKWFDDAWNNIVATQAVGTTAHDDDFDYETDDISTMIQFDRALFGETIEKISDTLIRVFKEASDDHIITRLMSSIDKCATICLHLDLDNALDKLVSELAIQTGLTDSNYRSPNGEDSDNSNTSIQQIPITQIQIDKSSTDDIITVSDMAVWFGGEFKAQISTVVLFRLVKKIDYKVTPSWNKIIKIILTLFENCLINPNLFTDFQKKLNMSALPKVKPKYVINRSKPLKDAGLLSTFSSFLKGYLDVPPEPSDQEVESTLSTIDCVKSINISSVFENVATKTTPEGMKRFINCFIELLPSYNEESNKRFYESETLFMFEIISCFALLLNDTKIINQTIVLLSTYTGQSESKELSKKGQLRLQTYKLLLFRRSDFTQELCDNLISSIHDLLVFDNESLVKNGPQLLPALISLTDSEESWCRPHISRLSDYWTIFRILSTVPSNGHSIIDFLTAALGDSAFRNHINPSNYMTFLGLLDELSSLGAIGSQYEQKLGGEYPKEIIELSKKSVGLTSTLTNIASREEFKGNEDVTYSLHQALAHQCFNPCREIRSYSMKKLQLAILQIDVEGDDNITAIGIFEYVLFPLLTELSKGEVIQTDALGFVKTRLEVTSLISKVFLFFNSKFKEGEVESVWLGLLNNLITFKELRHGQEVEQQTQPQDQDLETESEVLKNLILVLQSDGVLVKEKTEFWNETTKRVQVLNADLVKLFGGKEKEAADEEEKAAKQNLQPEAAPEKLETEVSTEAEQNKIVQQDGKVEESELVSNKDKNK